MTLEILAERETDRVCEEHGTPIVEYLVRGTELRSDWIIGVCEDCVREANDEPEETQS